MATPKPNTPIKSKTWGAGDPNYIKNMIALGKGIENEMANKPTLKAKVAQSTSQEAALAKLMAERAAIAKKTGMWPTDEQVMKNRKKR
jgi:hypothetical protein